MNEHLAYFAEAKQFIDTRLEQHLDNGEPLLETLYESVRYSLFQGGKRIRPVYCLIVADLLAVPREQMVSLACAVEMIHTASLIMDDLPHMDDAEIRRGKLANHVVYGQDVAALASIGLLTRAYEIVLEDPLVPRERKVPVVSALARVVGLGGMVGGQFVDLRRSGAETPRGTVEFIHRHKTVSLFVTAGRAAATLGGATEQQCAALERYAENLGLAFQIQDDLLDHSGDAVEVGKPLRRDSGGFVHYFGETEARRLLEEHTALAIAALEIFGAPGERLAAMGRMLLQRRS